VEEGREEVKVLGLNAFKKKFDLSQAQVNALVKKKTIFLQQNGYLGDSLHHRKLVVYPTSFRLPSREWRGVEEDVPKRVSRGRWEWCIHCRGYQTFYDDWCVNCRKRRLHKKGLRE
jgi:hypothetical protein